MKKVALYLFLLVIILGQQVPFLPFHYGYIDLSIPLLLTLGLWLGAVKGAVFGFLIGLIQASFSGYLVGTFLLTRSLIGWGGGVLQGVIVKDNAWAVSISSFWASIINDFIFLLAFPRPISFFLFYSILIKGFTSALFAPFFSFLLGKVYGE